MPRRGEPVGADAAVDPVFIHCLPERRKSDDPVSGADAGGVDHLFPREADHHRTVRDQGADEISDVRGLAPGHRDPDALRCHPPDRLVVPPDQRGDTGGINPMGIAPDRVGQ